MMIFINFTGNKLIIINYQLSSHKPKLFMCHKSRCRLAREMKWSFLEGGSMVRFQRFYSIMLVVWIFWWVVWLFCFECLYSSLCIPLMFHYLIWFFHHLWNNNFSSIIFHCCFLYKITLWRERKFELVFFFISFSFGFYVKKTME